MKNEEVKGSWLKVLMPSGVGISSVQDVSTPMSVDSTMRWNVFATAWVDQIKGIRGGRGKMNGAD